MKPYIKKISSFILLQILFDIFCTILAAFTPILQKWLFDYGIQGGVYKIIQIAGIYIIVQLLLVINSYLCMLFTWKGAIRFELLLKHSFIKSLFQMKNHDFYKKPIGEYISLQGNDITSLEQDYLQPFIDIIRSINMIIIYGIVIFLFVDYRIALTILLLSLITIIGPKLTGEIISNKRNEYLSQMAVYVSKITDLLEGFKLIDNYTRKNINKVHENVLEETADKRYLYGKAKTISLAVNDLAIKIIQIASFIVAGILLTKGKITIGTGVATFSYVSSFLQPIDSLLYDVSAIQSVKKVKEKFLAYTLQNTKDELTIPAELGNKISLKNINYEYDKFSIKNIDFDFEKGKKYAVIGQSGSGKSTLLKLIMKYLKPDSGSIFIDDILLSDLDTSTLISYIDQNEHIFRDGYIENATIYGSYSTKRLNNVINSLSIRMINAIKEKKSNDNSQELSGGEKQALAFLRLITKNASVILMDEPFSAVDISTREYLENYLLNDKELEEKTLIFVTHDVRDSLNKYDEVLLMKDGIILMHDKYEVLKETDEYKLYFEKAPYYNL